MMAHLPRICLQPDQSFAVLFSIVYLFSNIFTRAVTEHRSHEFGKLEDEHDYIRYFGSLLCSVCTLVQAITGGVNWEIPAKLLRKVDPIYEVILYVYVLSAYIGLLSVITSLFRHAAIESTSRDTAMIVETQAANRVYYTEQLREFFSQIDTAQTGEVTFSSFKASLKEPCLQAFFAGLDMTPSDAWHVFRLLDKDWSTAIDVEDFITDCLHLRDGARAIESHMQKYEIRWTVKKVSEIVKRINEISAAVRKLQTR